MKPVWPVLLCNWPCAGRIITPEGIIRTCCMQSAAVKVRTASAGTIGMQTKLRTQFQWCDLWTFGIISFGLAYDVLASGLFGLVFTGKSSIVPMLMRDPIVTYTESMTRWIRKGLRILFPWIRWEHLFYCEIEIKTSFYNWSLKWPEERNRNEFGPHCIVIFRCQNVLFHSLMWGFLHSFNIERKEDRTMPKPMHCCTPFQPWLSTRFLCGQRRYGVISVNLQIHNIGCFQCWSTLHMAILPHKKKKRKPTWFLDSIKEMSVDGICIFIYFRSNFLNRYTWKKHMDNVKSVKIKTIIVLALTALCYWDRLLSYYCTWSHAT